MPTPSGIAGRWDVATLFGFEYAEELGSYVWFRPEVGIMNMMGVIMLPMIVLLAGFQTTPPDWRVYPSICFLYVFLGMGVIAVSLQGAAFARTVLQRNEGGPLTVVAVSGVVVMLVMPLALMLGTVAYFDGRRAGAQR